jgi:hypothetical protein
VTALACPTDMGFTLTGHIQAVKAACGQCPEGKVPLALLGGSTASLSHYHGVIVGMGLPYGVCHPSGWHTLDDSPIPTVVRLIGAASTRLVSG